MFIVQFTKASRQRFKYRKYPEFTRESKNIFRCRVKTEAEAKRLVRKGRWSGYRAIWYDENWERGTAVRSAYFEKHKLYGGRGRCVYCGKMFPKTYLHIDHVIPVAKTRTSRLARAWLRAKGIHNVNDDRNLVLACDECNQAKGAKVGPTWLLRARFGSYKPFWTIVHILKVLLIAGLVALIIYILHTYTPYLSFQVLR